MNWADNIKVFNADCMDIMAQYPDNYFDLAVVDPPYGIDYQSARRIDKSQWKKKILNDTQPYTEWINLLFKKTNKSGRLLCFYRWDVQQPFKEEIENAGFKIKGQLIWDKIKHGMGDLNGSPAPQHESIIYATKGRYEFEGNRPKSIIKEMSVYADNMIHPNQKPVNLYIKLYDYFLGSGLNCIDLFGGSFSSAIAWHRYSKGQGEFIGVELDKEYYDAAHKRFKEQTAQLTLL